MRPRGNLGFGPNVQLIGQNNRQPTGVLSCDSSWKRLVQRPTDEDKRIEKPVPDGGQFDVSTLYTQHFDELLRLVTGVLSDGDLADDALQTAFARAVESGGPDKQESAKAWLFRVAVNEALTVKRRQSREKSHHEKLRRESMNWLRWPEDSLARAEVIARVQKVMGQLPSEEQQVLRSRVYDDLKFREIAVALGVPLGTVLTRMRRAMERLRKELSDLDGKS